ncbi:MAG: hypothetical protein KAU17_01095 [Spirochaetales bacterium]|nr:hypothetical protein [Spirochaetales bacterium]
MSTWRIEYQRGKTELARHKPKEALRHFEEALCHCPVSDNDFLYRILFFLGFTLKKLGLPMGALKSWNAATKVRKSGYSEKMLRRYGNIYGMPKQDCLEQDDWEAFRAIHVNRYLRTKRYGRFGTIAEKDMIQDLIQDTYLGLLASEHVQGKTAQEKLIIFHTTMLVFPAFYHSNSIIPFYSPDGGIRRGASDSEDIPQ